MTSQKKNRNRKPRLITALILILSFLIAVIPAIPLSAEKADTEEITIVREELDRRTANEKHFLCSDGSMMAVAYSGDVHYLDENGAYQAIDNTLHLDAKAGLYQASENPNFNVSFSASQTAPGAVLTDGKGNILHTATTVATVPTSAVAARALSLESAKLTLKNETKININGLGKEDARVTALPESHSEIVYQNAHGSGISSEYVLDTDTLKENVIFDYPVNYTAIKTEYTMPGLCVEVTEEGSLLLYNDTWDLVYTVAAPYMYDASGAECPAIAVSATQSGDTWTVRYVPDESWRTSSERVYPVVFDPSITGGPYSIQEDSYNLYVETVESDHYGENWNKNLSNSNLRVGVQLFSESYLKYDTYMKISLPNFPSGNVATQVQILLTAYEAAGNGTIHMYPVTGGKYKSGDFTLGPAISSFIHQEHEVLYSSSSYQYKINVLANQMNETSGEYVLRETSGGGSSHYVVFHSSRASTVSYRPKVVLYYVPQGITDKITTLYHSETSRYLTVMSDGTVKATDTCTPQSLWKFERVDEGYFVIVSRSRMDMCLGVNSAGDLILCQTPQTPTQIDRYWSVFVSGSTYTFESKEFQGSKLYVKDDGSAALDLNSSTTAAQKKWQMLDLTPGVNGVITSLANPEAGGFLVPTTDSTIDIVSGVTKDQWKFVQSPQQSFQIVSMDNSDYCLAADANGNVSLATKSSSVAQTTQYWYLTESQGGYIIENVANHKKLSVSTQNGALTCTLSDAEQVWTFKKYTIPYEVFALKNTDLYLTDETNENSRIDLYLKNMTGKNYNLINIHPTDSTKNKYNYDVIFGLGADNRIDCMTFLDGYSNPDNVKNTSQKYEAIGDMCGFRLKYESSENAYRLMPLSSGNGHQRALTVPAVSLNAEDQSEAGINSMVMYKCTDTYKPRQLFLLEMQMNGQFVIKLKSSPSLVLTASMENGNTTGNVTMNTRSGTLINQTWIMEEYMAYLPKNNSADTEYSKVSYKLLEEYCASLGFLSPMGDFELTVTSDFGHRDVTNEGSPVHAGIDFRTRYEEDSEEHEQYGEDPYRDLYAPASGTVLQTGYNSSMGNFIKIATNISIYEGSEYMICFVFMHLDSISVTSGAIIAGQKIGVTGDTGAGGFHLHYQVFLRKNGQDNAINRNPINPLLFVSPQYYVNGEPDDYRQPQV